MSQEKLMTREEYMKLYESVCIDVPDLWEAIKGSNGLNPGMPRWDRKDCCSHENDIQNEMKGKTMRLTAYKKLIDSALELPEKLEGADYFVKTKIDVYPRQNAIIKIINIARLDVDGLFPGEFIELYEYKKQETRI